MSLSAEVVRVAVTRRELTAEKVPALQELFGLARLPLAPALVEVEVRGVPTAVANALRRAVLDEMPGRCLMVPPGGFEVGATTDAFMLPQFVDQLRISLLPLRPQIPAEVVEALRLDLDVTNTTASTLNVYAGDLEVSAGAMPEPLFNPTFELAALQPGKRIVIRGIYISSGYGRDNGAYQVGRRGVCRPLDVPEAPEAETHDMGGAHADKSGFLVSCLVANPRHHLVSAVLPATGPDPAEARAVFADACANVKDRLRLVISAAERWGLAAEEGRAAGPARALARAGVQFTVVLLQEGLAEGVLLVPAETHTIGELLRRVTYEMVPEIVFVAYEIVAHENRLRFTLRHTEDVARILLGAARQSVAIFDALQRGISAAR